MGKCICLIDYHGMILGASSNINPKLLFKNGKYYNYNMIKNVAWVTIDDYKKYAFEIRIFNKYFISVKKQRKLKLEKLNNVKSR